MVDIYRFGRCRSRNKHIDQDAPCVTISLDLKFIGASKNEIIGHVKI